MNKEYVQLKLATIITNFRLLFIKNRNAKIRSSILKLIKKRRETFSFSKSWIDSVGKIDREHDHFTYIYHNRDKVNQLVKDLCVRVAIEKDKNGDIITNEIYVYFDGSIQNPFKLHNFESVFENEITRCLTHFESFMICAVERNPIENPVLHYFIDYLVDNDLQVERVKHDYYNLKISLPFAYQNQ